MKTYQLKSILPVWHFDPATTRQLKLLRFFGSDISQPLTKGVCSGIIARLLSDPANKHLWVAYVFTTGDEDETTTDLQPYDRAALASVQIPDDWRPRRSSGTPSSVRKVLEQMVSDILDVVRFEQGKIDLDLQGISVDDMFHRINNIFGVTANVSITKLFLAGIVPGVMMGIAIGISWWWVARKENVKPAPKLGLAERLSITANGTLALALPVVIIGGMKFGVFTPTEAAVVAAVYSFAVGMFIYRELKWSTLYGLILAAGKTTSVVMFLVAAAMVSAWLITVANIPTEIAALMEPFMGNKMLLMFVMMVLIVIVGTALDFAPTVLILTPARFSIEDRAKCCAINRLHASARNQIRKHSLLA